MFRPGSGQVGKDFKNTLLYTMDTLQVHPDSIEKQTSISNKINSSGYLKA